LAEVVDLSVLVGAHDGEDHDEDGQRHEHKRDNDSSRLPHIDLRRRAPQGGHGLIGRGCGHCGVIGSADGRWYRALSSLVTMGLSVAVD
jgi:hypothetical protein